MGGYRKAPKGAHSPCTEEIKLKKLVYDEICFKKRQLISPLDQLDFFTFTVLFERWEKKSRCWRFSFSSIEKGSRFLSARSGTCNLQLWTVNGSLDYLIYSTVNIGFFCLFLFSILLFCAYMTITTIFLVFPLFAAFTDGLYFKLLRLLSVTQW